MVPGLHDVKPNKASGAKQNKFSIFMQLQFSTIRANKYGRLR